MSSKSLLMTDNVLFAHIKAFFSLEAKKHKKNEDCRFVCTILKVNSANVKIASKLIVVPDN